MDSFIINFSPKRLEMSRLFEAAGVSDALGFYLVTFILLT